MDPPIPKETMAPSSPPPVTRCDICQKKIKLVEIDCCKCKCGHPFCMKHRLPEDHSCTIAYHAEYKNQLASNMQVIMGDKVVRF